MVDSQVMDRKLKVTTIIFFTANNNNKLCLKYNMTLFFV